MGLSGRHGEVMMERFNLRIESLVIERNPDDVMGISPEGVFQSQN